MIDFIFWNCIIFLSLLIVVKADEKKDFTIIAVTYIVTLWVFVSFIITTPFTLYGMTNSTDEYHELYSNETDVHPQTLGFHWEEYDTHNVTINRETYPIPQNFLDIIYNIYLFVFTYYSGRKLLFTELSLKAKKALKDWWK